MAPCWRGPCHVLLLRTNPLDSGVVRALLALGLSFSCVRVRFCKYGQISILQNRRKSFEVEYMLEDTYFTDGPIAD